jgi:enoyl-CoA hydratase/carnithine racemase
MKSSAIRRINTNLGFFKYFKKNFTQNENKPVTSHKSPDYTDVLYKLHNPNVFEITLNQPKKLNSLDVRMIKSLLKCVNKWVPEDITSSTTEEEEKVHKPNEEPLPKVVLLTGNGKHFCAGGDIKTLYLAKKSGENLKILKDFFRYEYLLDYSLTRIDPVLIAMWNGYVMGGGVGLSVNAPIRVATDSTVFGMPGKLTN